MAFRKLPTEPRGPAPFGAYYTKLAFDETWDEIRREDAHPDVVVLFDDMPWRFVSWRGTGYVPFWVTENIETVTFCDLRFSSAFAADFDADIFSFLRSRNRCFHLGVRILRMRNITPI